MANKICVKCDVSTQVSFQNYCYKCGGELTILPVCSCKYEFYTYEQFCPVCGKPRPTPKETK